MIKIENTEVFGWEAAIRGMRNPMNSWDKSDSGYGIVDQIDTGVEPINVPGYIVGSNDLNLMKTLAKAGSDHGKFLRMINVTCDITAMQPWWYEFDTYKVGTVRNSCSKMHKIHVKEFTADDFEHCGLDAVGEYPKHIFMSVIDACNWLREWFNKTQEKKYWRALIELLPEGYLMRATVQLNYQVLKSMYYARRNHKLDEWHVLCAWMLELPYFKEICVQED